MKRDIWKKIGVSALRITAALAVIFGLPAICFLAGTSHQKELSLILGIPAYEDAGVGYHYPNAENIASALRGIAAADRHEDIDGIALYCEWEMTEEKWQTWQKFIK